MISGRSFRTGIIKLFLLGLQREMEKWHEKLFVFKKYMINSLSNNLY